MTKPLQTVTPFHPSPTILDLTSKSPQAEDFEKGLKNTNDRLSRLENCCGMLDESTKNLEAQLTQINETFGSKLQDMATAINSLTKSPNCRNQKAPKPHNRPVMNLDL